MHPHMQTFTHTVKTCVYSYAFHTHMKMENKKNEKKRSWIKGISPERWVFPMCDVHILSLFLLSALGAMCERHWPTLCLVHNQNNSSFGYWALSWVSLYSRLFTSCVFHRLLLPPHPPGSLPAPTTPLCRSLSPPSQRFSLQLISYLHRHNFKLPLCWLPWWCFLSKQRQQQAG